MEEPSEGERRQSADSLESEGPAWHQLTGELPNVRTSGSDRGSRETTATDSSLGERSRAATGQTAGTGKISAAGASEEKGLTSFHGEGVGAAEKGVRCRRKASGVPSKRYR